MKIGGSISDGSWWSAKKTESPIVRWRRRDEGGWRRSKVRLGSLLGGNGRWREVYVGGRGHGRGKTRVSRRNERSDAGDGWWMRGSMEWRKMWSWGGVLRGPLLKREESGFLPSSFSFPLVNKERVYCESLSEG